MKESSYNLYTPVKQGILCFNTYSDVFAILPNSVYEVLLQNNFSALPPERIDMLKSNHFIVEDEVDEYELLTKEYKKTESSGVYYLTILPSLDCNVKCWYCFEKHIKGSHLSTQRQEQIFNYAKQILDSNTTLFVTLFGGEPLLYFKTEVYPLLLKIKEYATCTQKHIALSVTTNALCIDDEAIPLFAEFNTMFQISIDGYREKHNSVKKSPNIENSYEKVMSAIHLLTEAYDVKINLRINYDNQTLEHLPELIEDIKDIDRKKIKIHLERVWQTSPKQTTGKINVEDAINMLLAQNFCVSYMNFSRRNFSCINDAKNGIILSYDGSAYKCTGRDFTKELAEGYLANDGSLILKEAQIENRQNIKTYDNPVCRFCKLLPQCWGPCSQKQLEMPESIKDLCPLNFMEMNINAYICYRFNNACICKQNYGEDFPIEYFNH